MKATIQKILASNLTYFLLGIVTVLYVFVEFHVPKSSIYNGSETNFRSIVEKKVITENKISFTLSLEEDLICNYYSDAEDEKKALWEEVKLGSEVFIRGKLVEPTSNTIPNTFNYKNYLQSKGMFYTCTIDEIEVTSKPKNLFYVIKNFVIDRIMTFEIKDYLYTMIIGDKSLLDDEVMQNYRDNGVTHLFAISGMHIGLFAVILTRMFKKFKLKDKEASVLVVAFIWLYAFLAGFGASVMRATTLFTLLALNKMLQLKIDKLKILFLTGFTLIAIDYKIVADIGFIYSFVTTFGLIYASKVLSKHKILGTSLVASLFSLPLTINNFYKFNMASILFNVVFVFYVSTIVYPLCLATFFIRWLEPVTELAITILELLNSLCAQITCLQFVVPKMHIWLVILYYIILLLFVKKKLYPVCVSLFALVLLNKIQPLLDNNYHVEFMDVKQGDSIIIRGRHNKEVILIDTGGKTGNKSKYNVSDGVITYLNSLGIEHVDYLVLTHGGV